MNFILFIFLVVLGGLLILHVMVPNEWELLKKDWESFGNFILAIPSALWGVAKGLIDIPNRVLDSI